MLRRAGFSLLVAGIAAGGALVGLAEPAAAVSVSTEAELRARSLAGAFVRAPGGIRTPDPRIRSPLLYPLSYGRVLLRSECY